MSAASGIETSPELVKTFTDANESTSNVRFILIAIEKESLVPKSTIDIVHPSLQDDLAKLQDILENYVPMYVLARLGGRGDSGWLAISYVPDSANVRSKMLYASSRAAVIKTLGSAHFPDSLFANSKADLTPTAYAEHKASLAAPQPLSEREREIAEAREMERSTNIYEGMSARRNHVGTTPGTQWSEEATNAVKSLGEERRNAIVVLQIDMKAETLVPTFDDSCEVNEVASKLPPSEPAFAFFAWNHTHVSPSRRDIVFIYSCPTSSPVRPRMIYSATCRGLYHVSKSLLMSPNAHLMPRTVETSDPSEINEAFLVDELGYAREGKDGVDNEGQDRTGSGLGVATGTKLGGSANAFAKPRGPARKR